MVREERCICGTNTLGIGSPSYDGGSSLTSWGGCEYSPTACMARLRIFGSPTTILTVTTYSCLPLLLDALNKRHRVLFYPLDV